MGEADKLEIHQACYSSQTFYDSRTTQTEPFEESFKKQHEKLDTEEGESNEEEEKFTTSSEKSEQDSESDTSTEDEEESNITQTLEVHHSMIETTHDEEIHQNLKMIHQKMKMWPKCKHLKTMESKTYKKANS